MTKNRRFKRWEDIDSGKISDFKALYYVTQRVISKTERKIIQMGKSIKL